MREIKELKRKRDGFIMKNNENNVEIKCTDRFVKYWEELGFVVIEQKKIALVS
jgi:phage regulator Rha-like protein